MSRATPTRIAGWCLVALCSLLVSGTAAAGFSALVSPPRFEDKAKAGTTYRNVIEITNVSDQRARYTLRTADWQLSADGSAVFSEELALGSCRPWVGIEAPEILVEANAKRRYRFEVAVPADAPSGECRFAIMLEGEPEQVKGELALPVSGRIGVIVYLSIGDAAARLDVVESQIQTVEGRHLPMLHVRNSGNAHGRVEGMVDGTDASGRRFTFVPSNLPILAGETRGVVLNPEGDNDDTPAPAIAYPLTLKGRLEWGTEHLDVEATLSQ
ncbi:MAG TPA: hypothetical protein VGD21_03985 [Lysobacter sp.]